MFLLCELLLRHSPPFGQRRFLGRGVLLRGTLRHSHGVGSPVLDPGRLLRAVLAEVVLLVAELTLVEAALRAFVVAECQLAARAVPAPPVAKADLSLLLFSPTGLLPASGLFRPALLLLFAFALGDGLQLLELLLFPRLGFCALDGPVGFLRGVTILVTPPTVSLVKLPLVLPPALPGGKVSGGDYPEELIRLRDEGDSFALNFPFLAGSAEFLLPVLPVALRAAQV